ncbi:MAG: PTS sugar transporter subunit IIB [Candidatus Izemoplasmataceae bacterium]
MKQVKVMCVCGFGVGSSMILKMNVEDVLKSNGVNCSVEVSDVTSAASSGVDIVFASEDIARQLKQGDNPVIVIHDFLDKDEIKEKGLSAVQKIEAEKAK